MSTDIKYSCIQRAEYLRSTLAMLQERIGNDWKVQYFQYFAVDGIEKAITIVTAIEISVEQQHVHCNIHYVIAFSSSGGLQSYIIKDLESVHDLIRWGASPGHVFHTEDESCAEGHALGEIQASAPYSKVGMLRVCQEFLCSSRISGH